jgi:tetratricopeptide (TPR) repeat protein
MAYLKKALKEDPELDEAHFELAAVYEELDHPGEGLYHIKKALELDPENPDFLMLSGELNYTLGWFEEAEGQYRKVLELGYTDPLVYIDLSEVLFDQDRYQEALEVLEQGLAGNAKSEDLMYRLAGYYCINQEWADGLALLKRAYRISPEKWEEFLELFPELVAVPAIQNLFPKR